MSNDAEPHGRSVDLKNLKKIRAEIFEQQQGGRGIRFTQDSPILPDAWLDFAKHPDNAHDLLINPCRGKRAGEVARDMRILLRNWRMEEGSIDELDPAQIAHVPGLIVARLQFAELMRIVLPSTLWWKRCMDHLSTTFKSVGSNFNSDESVSQRILFSGKQIKILKGWMKAEWPSESNDEASRLTGSRGSEPPYDFLKLIRIAAMVLAARKGKLADGELQLPTGATETDFLVDTFVELFESWPANPRHPPTAGIVWSVTLNRRAEPAVMDSTRAMKADAGWHLFDISCKSLRWAVIDSGIDSQHDAFKATDGGEAHTFRSTAGEEERKTRVVSTYDFAELRMLLDPNFLQRLGHHVDPTAFELEPHLPTDPGELVRNKLRKVHNRLKETIEKRTTRISIGIDGASKNLTEKQRRDKEIKDQIVQRIDQVIKRIRDGLEIDWATIEPLIEDVTPDMPPRPHGTQVAGVLAANWLHEDKEGKANDEGKNVRLRGVCRDIRLIDLRVLSPDLSNNSEMVAHDFEVISALKFIGYLNARADEPYVHGANVSISIPHDVARFACGRTPICEECERLVSSGVVVVAAAGNSGYSDDNQVEDRFYRSGSITDPGNAEAVITVGSTHRRRPHQYGVSYFSSRGPTGDGRRKPDLVAPGEKITTPSPDGRFARVDGTSFAAPHVSGAAAMLMARHTELIGRPARIKEILCNSATCLGREPYYQGAGMLDVLRALQSV